MAQVIKFAGTIQVEDDADPQLVDEQVVHHFVQMMAFEGVADLDFSVGEDEETWEDSEVVDEVEVEQPLNFTPYRRPCSQCHG